MTDQVSEQRTILESELFLEGKRRERRGLMPEGAESYAKPFSATCIRQ